MTTRTQNHPARRYFGAIALLAAAGLVASACAAGAPGEDAGLSVQFKALGGADEGISHVQLHVERLETAGEPLFFDRIAALQQQPDGSAQGSAHFQLVPGDYLIRATAIDDLGAPVGEAVTTAPVMPGQTARVFLSITLQPLGTLQVGGLLCERHILGLGAESAVSIGAPINIDLRTQGTVVEAYAHLVDSQGQLVSEGPLVTGDGTTWTAALPASPVEGLTFVEITTTAESEDPACSIEEASVITFADDPATDNFSEAAARDITGYVNELTGTLVQLDTDAAFARVSDTQLYLDTLFVADGEPDQIVCAGPGDACGAGGEPICAVGDDELQGMPGDYGPGYRGSEHGGCDVWATLMCNRVLDIDGEGDGTADEPVDADEWNKVSGGEDANGDGDTNDPGDTPGVDENGDGATSQSENMRYYQSQGKTVTVKSFGGTPADYQEIADAKARGADVKLIFFEIYTKPDGSTGYRNGHSETVTGTNDSDGDGTADSANTNSWGEGATISGGSSPATGGAGGFTHSEADGQADADGTGDNFAPGTWPSDSTDVSVKIVN